MKFATTTIVSLLLAGCSHPEPLTMPVKWRVVAPNVDGKTGAFRVETDETHMRFVVTEGTVNSINFEVFIRNFLRTNSQLTPPK